MSIIAFFYIHFKGIIIACKSVSNFDEMSTNENEEMKVRDF